MSASRRDRRLERRLARVETKLDTLITLLRPAALAPNPQPDVLAAMAREIVGEFYAERERR